MKETIQDKQTYFYSKNEMWEAIKKGQAPIFWVFIFLFSFSGIVSSQTVQVGSGTAVNLDIPVYVTRNYSLTQTIYTAQELTDAGASPGFITRIRYKPMSDMPTKTWQDWVIYMSHTDKQGFRFQDKIGFSTPMEKVFDGKIARAISSGEWMEIILDVPFEWNGTENIIVMVDENTPGKSPSGSRWQSFTVDPGPGLWRSGTYSNDIINPDPSRPMDMGRSNVMAQIQFQFEPLCTGIPNAGQVPAVISNCPPFNLISTGSTEDAGVFGQWESAPAGTSNWAAVAGAIYPTSYLEVPPKVTTDYRYRVTCKSSGQTAVSGVINTTVQPVDDCYCAHVNTGLTPPGTIPFFYTSGALQDVRTVEEVRTKDYYTDYTEHTISQFAGDSVTFHTLLSKSDKFSIWVDWNQDGDFTDEGELVFFDGVLPNGGHLVASFKVPEDALPGLTRMRIGKNWSVQFSDPCPVFNVSSFREDFTFEVVPKNACAGKPHAGAVADHFLLPRGDGFTLATKGQSAGIGYGLKGQWEYKSAGESDWFPIEGATGTAFKIEVAPEKETHYRYVLTCTQSKLSDTSNVSVFTSANPQYADVIIPLNNPSSFYIKHFSTSGGVENIFHSMEGGGGTSNQLAAQKPGHVISFTGYTTRHRGTFVVYVDWNHDGDFDYEAYSVKDMDIEGDSMYRGSFPVPHFARPGKTKMRVIFKNNNNFVGGIVSHDYTFEVMSNVCSDITFPASINAESATSTLYGKGNISLNISTAFPIADGLSFQWQSSTDGQSWSNSGPAQSVAAKKMTNVAVTTQFRVMVYCGGNLQLTSNPVTITVEQVKEILSKTDGERCTPGSVTLTAYGEPGTTVNWYDSPTSSTPVFTGNIFETPALSESKTYYASVVMSSSDVISKKNVGQGNYTSNAVKKGKSSGFNPLEYNGHTPFKTNWSSRYQYLIPAEELREAGIKPGNIHSIAFDVTSETGVVFPNYTIAMNHTDKLAFVDGRLDSNFTTVYTGDVKLHLGENTFNFHTPFEWDGTSSVVVSLCNREQANGSSSLGSDVKFDFLTYTATKEASHGFWLPANCDATNVFSNGLWYYRPKMIFEAASQAEGPRVPVRANLDVAEAYATANSGQSKDQTYNVVHEYLNDNCEKLADILSTNNLGMVDVRVYMGTIPTTTDGIPFVGRFFTITPTQNFNAPSVITLYYSESDILAYNDHVRTMNDPRFGPINLQNPLSIRVYGYHGNINVGGAGPNGFNANDVMIFNPTEVVVKDGNVAITFTTMGFSGFYINGLMQAPLAISMGDIKAENKGNVNVVIWNTHLEESGDRFEIERSVNGNQFEVIGRITANGHPSDYSFIDENPIDGFNYYRLGMIHRDDSRKTYSKVVIAQKAASAILRLDAYPNPATEKVTVKISGSIRPNAQIQVIDMSGKVVKTIKVTKPEITVQLTNVGSGMYLFKYIDDERSSTLKVLKK